MRTGFHLWAIACIVLTGGCRLLDESATVQGHSPLRPAKSSPESVALEIVWARFPLGDPQINDVVWQDIDETRFPASLRRELAHNGFRVGVAGSSLPDAIARLLAPAAEAPDDASDSSDEEEASERQNELLSEPTVRRRLLQLRRGRRAEIQASEIYESLPLLVYQDRELGGRTYRDAQAILALRVDPQPDQTAVVELTPELQYGAPRLRWTSEDAGALHRATLRDRDVFASLRVSAALAPGEMLILTSLPDAASRLGHYFHTAETASGRQQKLILVRLAQVPPSETFKSEQRSSENSSPIASF